MGKTILSEQKMKISASLLFSTGGESARLRRDPQYRNYQAQLNQYDQFEGSYLADLAETRRPYSAQDLVNFDNDIQNVDLFNSDRDDFGYGGSKKEYYPIDITQGDNYGNSV